MGWCKALLVSPSEHFWYLTFALSQTQLFRGLHRKRHDWNLLLRFMPRDSRSWQLRRGKVCAEWCVLLKVRKVICSGEEFYAVIYHLKKFYFFVHLLIVFVEPRLLRLYQFIKEQKQVTRRPLRKTRRGKKVSDREDKKDEEGGADKACKGKSQNAWPVKTCKPSEGDWKSCRAHWCLQGYLATSKAAPGKNDGTLCNCLLLNKEYQSIQSNNMQLYSVE